MFVNTMLLGGRMTPLVLAQTDSYTSTSNASSYTFSGASIGAAPTGGQRRWVVAISGGRGGTTMSYREVPTGTTTNVVVEYVGTSSTGVIIVVYTLVRYGSADLRLGPVTLSSPGANYNYNHKIGGVNATMICTGRYNYNSSSWSGTVADGKEGGACIAGAASWTAGAESWTGLTENTDLSPGDGMNMTTASKLLTTNGDVSATVSGLGTSFSAQGVVAVNFR